MAYVVTERLARKREDKPIPAIGAEEEGMA
jgi:hypothetical protein